MILKGSGRHVVLKGSGGHVVLKSSDRHVVLKDSVTIRWGGISPLQRPQRVRHDKTTQRSPDRRVARENAVD